ncbi:type II toxin-antitoxin system HicB family antitoxin [Methylocystis sp. 9N]|uniref:Type II toxin-antitoxin system HicB family antitoxin n=1 Tax=Methylocystis borbori TaxID=3118750 RepID=A0ABU7XJV2_9HYPH
MSDPSPYHYDVAPLPPEDGGGYVVSFPDIPGCLGVGETPEEAIEDAKAACFACLDALKAVDRPAPVPSAPAA